MIAYEVSVQKDTDGNFLNLRQLDTVKTIELVGRDRQGNDLYQVETLTKIDRELELISGVLAYQAGPGKPAMLTSIDPATGET